MDLQLADKVAIVTGAASGIGRCAAEHLAREAARVVLADCKREAIESTASEMAGEGLSVVNLPVDVRHYEQCEELVRSVLDRFGRVDILVNSAGIGGDLAFFTDTQPAGWQELIAVNLLGVMNCCRAVAGPMSERRYGKIVSLASEAGKANEKRMVVYGTTKGGVISLTRGLALELGRYSINVNAVCPGVTHTAMTSWLTEELEQTISRRYPLGRLGRPEDIAPLITFLVSDRASWITGQAISVSGGFGRS